MTRIQIKATDRSDLMTWMAAQTVFTRPSSMDCVTDQDLNVKITAVHYPKADHPSAKLVKKVWGK